MKQLERIRLCACGCHLRIKNGNKYRSGHNSRVCNPMQGKIRPKEWCKAQSKRMKGRTKENSAGIATMAEKMKVICSGSGNPMYGRKGPNNPNYGKKPWNIGKRKETDSRIAWGDRVTAWDKEKRLAGLIAVAKKLKGRKRPEQSRKMKKLHSENPNWGKEAWRKNFSNPEFCKWWGRIHGIKPNRLEFRFNNFLQGLFPEEYRYVGDFQYMIGGKNPDFANCNGQKKLIELYGDYWHQDEDPQERIDHFKQYGFSTLVIWESEFLDNSKQTEEKLKAFNSV